MIDQGVRTWGGVRLVLAAAALALGRRAARRGLPLGLAATSTDAGPEPASGMAGEALGRLMDASDLSPHPGPALRLALEAPAGAVLRDVVLLTHPRNLTEPDVAAAARRAAPGTRLFAVAVDESGGVELSEVRRGVPVLLSRCRVTMPEDAPTTPASGRVGGGPWTGDVEPIGFPFQIGAALPIEDGAFDFDHAGEWVLAASGKFGFLHAWKVDGAAMEMLPRALIDGRPLAPVEAVVGVGGGFVVAGRRDGDLVAAHYDFAARTCTAHEIGPPPGSTMPESSDGLRWSYDRAKHALVVASSSKPSSMARAVDLGADRHLACFRGKPFGEHSKRAMLAAVGARKLPPSRMLVVADGFPLPPEGDAIRLDRESGLLGARAGGVWGPVHAALGRPARSWKGGRILQARCGGGNLAVLSEDSRKRRSLDVFAMPDGRSLGSCPVGANEGEFVLSRDGRRLGRLVSRLSLEVREVGESATRLVTRRGRVHDRLHLSLKPGGLVLRVGQHVLIVGWDEGPLRVIHTTGRSEHEQFLIDTGNPLIPATRAGSGRADPDRFTASCACGWITAMVDVLGHVAILDADLATVAIFHAFRGQFAACLPDGTPAPGHALARPPGLDRRGPPTPGAAERIAEALRRAERRGGAGR